MVTNTDNPVPSNGNVGRRFPETTPSLPGPCLLRELTPRNLLSFGPETPPFPLGSLNVLIGPNGSGKSNLLEVVSLLRSTPKDCRNVIARGGGVAEWIWKGQPHEAASIDAVVDNSSAKQPLRHVFEFKAANQSFQIADERIENALTNGRQRDPYSYYRFQGGQPVLNDKGKTRRPLSRDKIDPELSILAQRRDPDNYPEITYLAGIYDRIRLYREWDLGRNPVLRQPQKADLRNDRLEEDFSNLGLVLNRLRRDPQAKKALLKGLKDLYEGLTDFDVSIEGGTVQVFFTEGEFTIPATRLSDGSVRFLCLLAILCDPNPPPLIGIEEPELGLHPDLLPGLTDLLIAAARRCQLIVTTHFGSARGCPHGIPRNRRDMRETRGQNFAATTRPEGTGSLAQKAPIG